MGECRQAMELFLAINESFWLVMRAFCWKCVFGRVILWIAMGVF